METRSFFILLAIGTLAAYSPVNCASMSSSTLPLASQIESSVLEALAMEGKSTESSVPTRRKYNLRRCAVRGIVGVALVVTSILALYGSYRLYQGDGKRDWRKFKSFCTSSGEAIPESESESPPIGPQAGPQAGPQTTPSAVPPEGSLDNPELKSKLVQTKRTLHQEGHFG